MNRITGELRTGKTEGMYQTILFDLDGTLTDSGPGITNSVAYALEKFGITVEDRTTLNPFVGPPLLESFAKYFGFSEERGREALGYYREYYQEKGIFENSVYEGIRGLLRELKKAGKTVVLATSKPEVFAVQIMEHFQLAEYFDVIAGASFDETRVEKSDVIRYALSRLDSVEEKKTVMVGDRENDVRGARENGLPCIGVLYGYGSREELETAGAACIAESVQELGELLAG